MGVRDVTPWLPLREQTLDRAEVYEILGNERRRLTLQYLITEAGQTSVSALADSVACAETDERPPPDDHRESVYNSLYQTHLPKLEQVNVVAHDKDDNAVRLTAKAREVDRYLTHTTATGLSWGEYYQLLGVGSLLSVLFAQLDIAVFAAVEPLLVTTLALATLAVSGLYQTWTRRWVYLQSLFS